MYGFFYIRSKQKEEKTFVLKNKKGERHQTTMQTLTVPNGGLQKEEEKKQKHTIIPFLATSFFFCYFPRETAKKGEKRSRLKRRRPLHFFSLPKKEKKSHDTTILFQWIFLKKKIHKEM